MEEQKNPASTTSKRTYIHRANWTPKDPIYQNKSFKHIENFKLFNRRRKPDRSSSYNIYSEKDEETSKDTETEPKSNPDLELKSFICVIRNFDLDNNKSSCSINSLNFKNNAEDFETEDGYLTAFNRLKKPLKRLPNRPDLLLYNTGITNHIVNDKKWFKNDYTFNRG